MAVDYPRSRRMLDLDGCHPQRLRTHGVAWTDIQRNHAFLTSTTSVRSRARWFFITATCDLAYVQSTFTREATRTI